MSPAAKMPLIFVSIVFKFINDINTKSSIGLSWFYNYKILRVYNKKIFTSKLLSIPLKELYKNIPIKVYKLSFYARLDKNNSSFKFRIYIRIIK